MAKYEPIATSVRMSDYGYWVVTVSVAPDKRIDVMICTQGISPDDAAMLALGQVIPAQIGGS